MKIKGRCVFCCQILKDCVGIVVLPQVYVRSTHGGWNVCLVAAAAISSHYKTYRLDSKASAYPPKKNEKENYGCLGDDVTVC